MACFWRLLARKNKVACRRGFGYNVTCWDNISNRSIPTWPKPHISREM